MKLHQIAPVMSRILFVVVVLFLGAMRAEARTTAKLLGSAGGRGKPSDGADRLEVERLFASGGDHVTNQEKFIWHEDRFSVHEDKFGVHEDKFSLHEDKFSLHEDRFSVHEDRFIAHKCPYMA